MLKQTKQQTLQNFIVGHPLNQLHQVLMQNAELKDGFIQTNRQLNEVSLKCSEMAFKNKQKQSEATKYKRNWTKTRDALYEERKQSGELIRKLKLQLHEKDAKLKKIRRKSKLKNVLLIL